MDFKQELIDLIVKNTKLKNEEVENLIAVPPDPKLGDYAFPCFKLMNSFKVKNPKVAAEKLKDKIGKELPKFIAKVDVVGPYLNFFLDKHIFVEQTLTNVYKQAKGYGQLNIGKGKVIAMDYSHPNIAKPFGIGHLRSTVIGNCLYQVFGFLGYKPVSLNHLGDWGTQFGKLIVAFKKWGDEKKLEKEPIKYLLKLYVRFHEEAEKDETYNEQARVEFKKMEDGDEDALTLWKLFKELSLKEFQKIYDVLDVKFDSFNGEAFINKFVGDAIEELKKKVPVETSEGALIVDLEKYDMPPVLLLKSDEASTYHSRDIATILYRFKKYKAQKILYIVGCEQKLHFKQLFKVMELAGYDKDKFVHADFGHFRFPEGKMSTRKGNVIFLEEVLDKAVELAKKIIEKKNPHLANKEEVAKQVGVGAIIFADLSNDRIRDINFDWDRMLSFEGETAPYVQYTHARACSILRKAAKENERVVSDKVNFGHLLLEEEMMLVRMLYDFSDVLMRVASSYKPHHLANYLITLGQAFNEFYHKCPVISEVHDQMKARLLLVDCVRQVLENGLGLLGIKAPEEM